MNAKQNILKRLRQSTVAHHPDVNVGLLPARKITRNIVDEFAAQAEISGATVVQIKSEELANQISNYVNKGATVVNAALAIAETGSVALRSVDSPSANSYLCDHLVVCVAKERVVPYLNDGLTNLTAETTRALHLMTGPSRTADVEQTIQIGAHGPRQLTIVIYSNRVTSSN